MLTSINGKIGEKPLLLGMTHRQALINGCLEFRKTARPQVPWDKTCEQEADEKLKSQRPIQGAICFREIYQKNKQLINIA
ncbi:unnamed protein product, partial [marine sediment metagenome]